MPSSPDNPIRILAGHHDRPHGPVRLAWPYTDTPTALVTEQSDLMPVQRDGDDIVFLPLPSSAGEEIACTPVYAPETHYAPSPASGPQGVQLVDNGTSLCFLLDRIQFTAYHYANVPARPYFWPVLSQQFASVTRSWPMSDSVGGETRDHPHHRSLYFAYGDVNGTDNWSEETGHGYTKHRSVDEVICGHVYGRFSTTSDWTDNAGQPILEQKVTATVWNDAQIEKARQPLTESEVEEERAVTEKCREWGVPVDIRGLDRYPAISAEALERIPVELARRHQALPCHYDADKNELYIAMAIADYGSPYVLDEFRQAARCPIRTVLAAPSAIRRAIERAYNSRPPYPTCRLMDVDLRLTATHGDVHFGDTKEGGMLTVRVASALDVPRGGRITNAYGGIDEAETWGKTAHWCDYSGQVDGKDVGITVMDHPDSFRYPTYWHVRNYGLMAANPFALNDYTNGAKNGSHTLKDGDTLRFRYRVLVHNGDVEATDVRSHYLNFVAPAKAIQEG